MALGGGTFTTQNKVLPGSYINFVSAARASATLSDRGVVAFPFYFDWGETGKVVTLTAEDFQKNSLKLLGYAYTADELMPLRELFKHAQKVLLYNIWLSGNKASVCFGDVGFEVTATAKYTGSAGNNLKIVVQANVDEKDKWDISTYMGDTLVDEQTCAKYSDIKENDYVTWKYINDAPWSSAPTTGATFSGGKNSGEPASGFQASLDAFEAYSFNVLCVADGDMVPLSVEYTKRMRDKVGAKFQLVVNSQFASSPDYEGVISIKSPDDKLVYWAAGALAGCAVNKSLTNTKYDGELDVTATYTQTELEGFISAGYFAFHMVEDELRVLTDINSFTSFTDEKGDAFSSNQVIRVIDQCANDTAKIFNTKYLGKVQNDKSGRVSFWNDIVSHRKQLQTIRAIEDYDTDGLTVEQGDAKNSVVVSETIIPTCAMEKLYMTTVIE